MKLVKESLEENWKDTEREIEPWGQNMELMDKMLDQFELEQPLDEYSWEQIQDIKTALWIGYNFK